MSVPDSTRRNPARRKHRIAVCAWALALAAPSLASAQMPDKQDPDAQIVTGPAPAPKTPAELKTQAWTMLTSSVEDDKHPDARVQALAALRILGRNPRSVHLIENAMLDKDIDVRVAAALAAPDTRSPAITSNLRQLLDDKEPPVAYAAALSLWKMNDRSGEDILMAVADGERTAGQSMLGGTAHSISKDLHHPGAMARFGAMQGAGMFLGPFGYGITAYEYIHKNGGDAARVSAIEAIAQNRTTPIRLELVAALTDKDLGVRAAAAKALATWHEPSVSAALANVFYDSKPPVRLTAAAAYLLSTGAVASPTPHARTR